MGKALIFGFFAISSLNLLALSQRFYSTLPWFDILLHFLGGFWVAGLFFLIFNSRRLQVKNFSLTLILALSFIALVGVVWEFAEFTFLNSLMANIFKGLDTRGTLDDTIADLAFDFFGGLAFLIIYRFKFLEK